MTRLVLASLMVMAAGSAAMGEAVDLGKGGEAMKGVNLDMGTKRVNWTNARWVVANLDKPLDLSKARGLRLKVSTENPRSDAGVYLAVKEASGTWYYVGWATDLTQKENVGEAYFKDFATADYVAPPGGGWTDANGKLDTNGITAIAVGCINPLGVGKVSFSVTGLETVPLEEAKAGVASAEVTGNMVDINGTTMVPAGLFGGFNLKEMTDKTPRVTYYRLAQDRRINPGGPTMGNEVTNIMINTIGDRTGASMRLTDAKWKENVEAMGAKYGEAAKAGKKVYVEWWNEPYLNWANINRKNFDPKYFDESKAVEGGAVTLKLDGSEMPHLKWTQKFPVPAWNWNDNLQQFRRGKNAKGEWTLPYAMPYAKWTPPKWRQSAAQLNPPDTVKDGETYTVEVNGKKQEYTAFTPWTVYDETQFTYWSGKGLLKPYVDPMLAFGKPFKEIGGANAVYIVGWGNRPSEDHWAGFKQLYQPTIDAGGTMIDGVCDHDYGGDPRKMPANYEMITAYGMTKHGKWLTSWNTETAMGGDTQAYAGADVAAGAQFDVAKFNWLTTKLLHALVTVPDKARSFSWFGIGGGWFSDTGEGQALLLLKNLRGKLVEVQNADPELYIVASVDGTDPENPRPADMPQRKELVVAICNDSTSVKAVDVKIAAPAGTAFSEAIVRAADASAGLKIVEKTEPAKGGYALKRELQPKEVVVVTLPLTGEIAGAPTVTTRQFFSKDILTEVTPEKPSVQKVEVAAEALSGAKKAWITFTAERLSHGEGTVVVNGKAYTLPAAVTPENAAWVRKLELKVEDVKGANVLEFRAKAGGAGYLLPSVSVCVEK